MHVAPVACQIHACFAFRKGSRLRFKRALVKETLMRFVLQKRFLFLEWLEEQNYFMIYFCLSRTAF
jgi:hypothetical protein